MVHVCGKIILTSLLLCVFFFFLQAAKKAKSKQPSARKSSQKRSRKSKGGSDAEESQGTLFDIVKAGKGALRVHCIMLCSHENYSMGT